MEIIIIYFIKFSSDKIKLLFDDKEIKKMIIEIFKLEKTNFLNEKLLDEKTTEIFVNQCINIESILGILKLNSNFIDYLKKIEQNCNKIFKEIESLKSLKGLFKVDFSVSLSDNLDVLINLHNSLLAKQKNKKKYFINFLPIIKKYQDLYIKHDNLEGLCALEIMTFEEKKIFENIIKIKDLNKEIIYRTKELLKNKINRKDLTGQKLIEILSKLKHHFSDETFNIQEKINIINFIIKKCKENDNEMMNEYKQKEIWKLFSTKNEKEYFLSILKKQDFDKKDNFLGLFPEDLNEQDIEVIISLINKIIDKENEIN